MGKIKIEDWSPDKSLNRVGGYTLRIGVGNHHNFGVYQIGEQFAVIEFQPFKSFPADTVKPTYLGSEEKGAFDSAYDAVLQEASRLKNTDGQSILGLHIVNKTSRANEYQLENKTTMVHQPPRV